MSWAHVCDWSCRALLQGFSETLYIFIGRNVTDGGAI